MQFVVSDLIARSRTHLDDEGDGEEDGFISPERWLDIFNICYRRRYAQWVRSRLISLAPTDQTFAAATVAVTGVMAIVGVAEDMGNGVVRPLYGAQSGAGRAPFWQTNVGYTNQWEAHGPSDDLTITLRPAYSGGNYFVRYIPTLAKVTSAAATVDLPFLSDELLVLDMVEKAGLKGHDGGRLLQKQIADAEGELNFQNFGKALGDSPRARVTKRSYSSAIDFNMDPRYWRWV